MFNQTPRRQRGFTLVEISIVLVVIGLLLGGVLKGQELITSARVRSLADQNAAVQAAYYGFIDRYRQVPGDWSATAAAQVIPGVTTGGNGNGRLDASNGSEWAEPLAVWEQLSRSGFIHGGFVGGSSAPALGDATLAPRNPYNGFVMLARTRDYLDPSGNPPERLNFSFGRGIPVSVLRELDLKIDDGLPQTGAMRAATTVPGTLGEIARSSSQCVDTSVSPPVWDMASNVQDCSAVYLY